MDHAAALIEENRLLAEVLRADPATPVPACPGWTVRQLRSHVGRGHRWAATIVRERSPGPVDIRTVADGKAPEDEDGAAAWLLDSAQLVLDAVTQVGPDTPVWTFTGPRPAAWWVRRRLHETTVHRADAASAVGAAHELDPALAADGVAEYLDLVVARTAAGGPPPLDAGVTLHLHATDDGLGVLGEWLVRGTGTGVEWEPGHGKGAAAVRGRAVDLLLGLLRGHDAADERLECLGEPAVWTTWLERTPF